MATISNLPNDPHFDLPIFKYQNMNLPKEHYFDIFLSTYYIEIKKTIEKNSRGIATDNIGIQSLPFFCGIQIMGKISKKDTGLGE